MFEMLVFILSRVKANVPQTLIIPGNNCDEFTSTITTLESTIKTCGDLISQAQALLERRKDIINWLETDHSKIEKFFRGDVTQIYALLEPFQPYTFLFTTEYDHVYSADLSWRLNLSTNVFKLTECYERLKIKSSEWKTLETRIPIDIAKQNDHSELKNMISGSSSSCSTTLEAAGLSNVNDQGRRAIASIEGDITFYKNAIIDGEACFDTILTEYNKFYGSLNQHLKSINEQIDEKAKKYYSKFVGKMNTLIDKHDLEYCENILTKQQTLQDNHGLLESVTTTLFNKDEATSLLNDSRTLLELYLGCIPVEVTNKLSNAINDLSSLISNYEQLTQNIHINENLKSDTKTQLDHITKVVQDIKRDYQNDKDKIKIHRDSITEMISNDITHLNLECIVEKEKTINTEINKFQANYKNNFKCKLPEFNGQQTTLEESLVDLTENFKRNRDSLDTMVNEYKRVQQWIDSINNTDISAAVKAKNMKFVDDNFIVINPTESIEDVNLKLESTKTKLNDSNIKHNNENSKILALQTEASAKSTIVTDKYNDLIKFNDSVKNYESKLIQAYINAVSEPVGIKYQTLNNYFIENSSQSNKLKTKLDTHIKKIGEYISNIGTIKSNGEAVIQQYNQIVGVKTKLSQKINIHPKDFQKTLNDEKNQLNLNLKTSDVISNEVQLSRSTDVIINTFDQYSKDNQIIISKFDEIKESVNEYISDVSSTIEDVTKKNTDLISLVGLLREKLTLTDSLIKTISDKKTALDEISRSKNDYLSNAISKDQQDYEIKKQEVTSAKERLFDSFKMIQNLYVDRHNIKIDKYDKNFAEKISVYEGVLTLLLNQKETFSTNSNSVTTQLEQYKETAIIEYKSEANELSTFISSIRECITNLVEKNNYESYSSVMATCNGVVTTFDTQNKRNQQVLETLQSISSNISNLNLSSMNYAESVGGIKTINESSDQMIKQYTVELRNLYIEKNKIRFEQSEVQTIFDALEIEFTTINGLTLDDFDKPDTTAYNTLSTSIGNEINIFNGFKDKYPKMNVDSVINVSYNSLPGTIRDIEKIKERVDESMNNLNNYFSQAIERKNSFDSKKLTTAQIKTNIDQLIASYSTHLTDIWEIPENEWDNRHTALGKQMKDTFDEIKSKLQELAEINNQIRDDKENYTSLKNKIDLIVENLRNINTVSFQKIDEAKNQNNKLDGYLKKYTDWTLRNEEITPMLSKLDDDLNNFNERFQTQVESLKTEIDKSINFNVSLLETAKTEALGMKSAIEQKIRILSELYSLKKEDLNEENTTLIQNMEAKLDSLSSHCDNFRDASLERQRSASNSLSTLQETTSSDSTSISNKISSYRSKLECCKNVINGINCINGLSKELSECGVLISGFSNEEESSKINSLNNKFLESLESQKLPSGDIFGIESLNKMKASTPQLSEFSILLEESFKRQFQKIKLNAVSSIISKVDSEMTIHNESINSNFAAIAETESHLKVKLDRYKVSIDAHKNIYIESKEIFNNEAESANKIENCVTASSKNNYIKMIVNQELKVSDRLLTYSNDLNMNKKFTDFHYQNIITFLKDKEAFMKNMNEAKNAYTGLFEEVNLLKVQLTASVNDETLNGKVKFDEFLDALKSQLKQKHSEINHQRAILLNGKNTANQISTNVDRHLMHSSSQITLFESDIQVKKNRKDTLINNLNTLQGMSNRINENVETFLQLKQRLISLQQKLSSKYEEANKSIEVKNENLVQSKTSFLLLLKLNTKKTLEPLNKYYQALNRLETSVSKARIDLPLDLVEIIDRNNKLRDNIQSKYAELENILDKNFSNGKFHYLRETNNIKAKYTQLRKETSAFLQDINVINEKLINQNVDELSEPFFENSKTKPESIENFILHNKEITFEVTPYKLEAEVSCDSDFSKKNVGVPNDIIPIENLIKLLDDNKNSPKNDKEKEINLNSDPINDISDQVVPTEKVEEKPKNIAKMNQTENNIVQGQMKDMKSFNLISFIIFLAFVVTFIVGINAIIVIRRRNKDKSLYQQCENVYIPLKWGDH